MQRVRVLEFVDHGHREALPQALGQGLALVAAQGLVQQGELVVEGDALALLLGLLHAPRGEGAGLGEGGGAQVFGDLAALLQQPLA